MSPQCILHTSISSCCCLSGLLTALSCFQISLLYVRLNKTSAPCQVILGHQITNSNSWPLRRRYYGAVSSMKSHGSTPIMLLMSTQRSKARQRFNKPVARCKTLHRHFFPLSFCVWMRRGNVFAGAMPKATAAQARSPRSAI